MEENNQRLYIMAKVNSDIKSRYNTGVEYYKGLFHSGEITKKQFVYEKIKLLQARVSDLKKVISLCDNTINPGQCKSKIENDIMRWGSKIDELMGEWKTL